jgi:hypothetical protein
VSRFPCPLSWQFVTLMNCPFLPSIVFNKKLISNPTQTYPTSYFLLPKSFYGKLSHHQTIISSHWMLPYVYFPVYVPVPVARRTGIGTLVHLFGCSLVHFPRRSRQKRSCQAWVKFCGCLILHSQLSILN